MTKHCHSLIWFFSLWLPALTLPAQDDLAPLSDEFNYGQAITNWLRIYQVEGWGNNALQQLDINASRPGRMFMRPYSSSWYEEFRGELTFKYVSGDFVITTDVEPTRHTGSGAPNSQYSLAGIMIRTPRTMTDPSQWTPLGQNYVFLSLGAASTPGTYQFEVKTTVNSTSTLHITDGAPSRAMIQVARLGPHIITLQRPQGGNWQVHRRYYRADMPAQLQAGLTVYTDWPLCSGVGYQNQNTRVLTNGTRLADGSILTGANPDLLAAFDFVRYRRPQIPADLIGANFSSAGSVSDAQLLSFLGANASQAYHPPPQLTSPPAMDQSLIQSNGFPVRVLAAAGLSCTLEASADQIEWTGLTTFPGTGAEQELIDPTAADHPFRFYRVRVNP